MGQKLELHQQQQQQKLEFQQQHQQHQKLELQHQELQHQRVVSPYRGRAMSPGSERAVARHSSPTRHPSTLAWRSPVLVDEQGALDRLSALEHDLNQFTSSPAS